MRYVSKTDSICEHHMSKMLFIGHDNQFSSAKAWDIVKELCSKLDDFPIWEPDTAGEQAKTEKYSYMYALLDEAYKQGRAAAKAAAAAKLSDIILRA